ncbi:MAG: segregation protein B [Acidobacteria bacterium]|nr:MAG: segregation protein B [Acidobacteriota bacterium]
MRAKPYRVAIVGAASLRGKEVAEVLNDRNFPAVDIKLLDDDEALGQLETMGDEVTFIQRVRNEQFDHLDFTFFASDQNSTRKSWKTARDAGSAIVDLSYALEDEPSSAIRSPWIERQLGQTPVLELQPGPCVIAHPAAVSLALLVLRAQKAGKLRHVACTVLEPASEHGQKGMDELHEQTVNLLSFQELPKNVFDTQVAFNLAETYGPNSTPTLQSTRQRILKHYQRIAGQDALQPAIQLIQAPIFHGHAFSIYMEMEEPIAVGDLGQALAGEHVTVTRQAEDSPSNVNAAGQGDILLSLTRDENNPTGMWLWAAADNLRIAAVSAVECAETMTPTRPRGKIQ